MGTPEGLGSAARHPHACRSRSAPAARRDPIPNVSPHARHRLKSTPGRPCGPVIVGSPRSGKSATQSGRIRYQILPRRTQVHGLPALSAPSPGCSGRFLCAAPQPRDRISYASRGPHPGQLIKAKRFWFSVVWVLT